MSYGLSLLYFFYDKYINKKELQKYSEGFIIGLVLLALAIVGLGTSGSTIIKQNVKSSQTTSTSQNAQDEEGFISKEELARNNGLNGQPCWVAIDSEVYDASDNSQWKNGQHTPSKGQAKCGQDLTSVLAEAPHGSAVLAELTLIGKLRTN